jgi:hypothetical protein
LKFVSGFARFALFRLDFRLGLVPAVVRSSAYVALRWVRFVVRMRFGGPAWRASFARRARSRSPCRSSLA